MKDTDDARHTGRDAPPPESGKKREPVQSYIEGLDPRDLPLSPLGVNRRESQADGFYD